jgi:hypothetical protein
MEEIFQKVNIKNIILFVEYLSYFVFLFISVLYIYTSILKYIYKKIDRFLFYSLSLFLGIILEIIFKYPSPIYLLFYFNVVYTILFVSILKNPNIKKKLNLIEFCIYFLIFYYIVLITINSYLLYVLYMITFIFLKIFFVFLIYYHQSPMKQKISFFLFLTIISNVIVLLGFEYSLFYQILQITLNFYASNILLEIVKKERKILDFFKKNKFYIK